MTLESTYCKVYFPRVAEQLDLMFLLLCNMHRIVPPSIIV